MANQEITYADKTDGVSTWAAADANEVKSVVNNNASASVAPSTETVSSTPATIAASGKDHTVFVDTDTAGSDVALTITDATTANDRLTIVAIGAFKVTLTITGLTDEEVPIGEARSYVWTGTAWVLASGGGGTDLGEVQIPQPKTWVEKYSVDANTGDVTNQWGIGRYRVYGTASADSAERQYTFIIDLHDETSNQNSTTIMVNNDDGHRVRYDFASGAFQIVQVGTPSSTVYIKAIERWEDDPDNLPLQTVPSDPSLIKDWVTKWNTGGANDVPNAWGAGKYMITGLTSVDANVDRVTFVVDVLDLTASVSGTYDGTTSVPGWFGYENSTNSFKNLQGTFVTEILEIKKWEDVAGADAQLNPPVDGWEELYNSYSETLTTLPLSRGNGEYTAVIRNAANTEAMTSKIRVNAGKVTSLVYGSTASTTIQIRYDETTNNLVAFASAGTWYFAELHYFTSLVNVLHSYNPDPRQVAQKDWVELYKDWTSTSSTMLNVWGDGKYIFTIRQSTDARGITALIEIDDNNTTVTTHFSANARITDDVRIEYTVATKTFTAVGSAGTWYIARVQKLQDSLASDSPRTVLDDGFETVYEDYANTSTTITQAVGNGTYEVLIQGAVGTLTAIINIDNSDSGSTAVYDKGNNMDYVVSTGVWDTQLAGYYIKRIRKFTGKTVIDAQYTTISLSDGPNQVQAINTDAGDVAVTLPASPSLGDLFEVWNTGTNGNHVTGLPNSITLGDGKGIRLRYVNGWKYEDVIIDEYSVVDGTSADVTHYVQKWAGGRMLVHSLKDNTTSGNRTVVFPEAFTSIKGVAEGGVACKAYIVSYTLTGAVFASATLAGGSLAAEMTMTTEGRWKAGV